MERLLEALNREFVDSPLTFLKGYNDIPALITVDCRLKNNEFMDSDSPLIFKDAYYVKVQVVFTRLGYGKVLFNNTGRSFWTKSLE